jgi:hypothetical protein
MAFKNSVPTLQKTDCVLITEIESYRKKIVVHSEINTKHISALYGGNNVLIRK